jgi:hypothetical protein
MSRRLKLAGRRFGKWRVLTQVYDHKQGRPRCLVRCTCGHTKLVAQTNLVNGVSKACRTCALSLMGWRRKRRHSLAGKSFGEWTFVKRGPRTKGNKSAWYCKCSCGRRVLVDEYNVTSGSSKRCMFCARLKRPFHTTYLRFIAAAKRAGRGCSISYRQFLNFTKQVNCHYCYAPILWSKHCAGMHGNNSKYYLDRKNNRRGYHKSNCVVCCTRCNYGKGAAFSYAEWRAMTAVFRQRANAVVS